MKIIDLIKFTLLQIKYNLFRFLITSLLFSLCIFLISFSLEQGFSVSNNYKNAYDGYISYHGFHISCKTKYYEEDIDLIKDHISNTKINLIEKTTSFELVYNYNDGDNIKNNYEDLIDAYSYAEKVLKNRQEKVSEYKYVFSKERAVDDYDKGLDKQNLVSIVCICIAILTFIISLLLLKSSINYAADDYNKIVSILMAYGAKKREIKFIILLNIFLTLIIGLGISFIFLFISSYMNEIIENIFKQSLADDVRNYIRDNNYKYISYNYSFIPFIIIIMYFIFYTIYINIKYNNIYNKKNLADLFKK